MTPAARPETTDPGVPARILLVEDSPTQAVFTRSALVAAGYVVDVARNGRAGLASAQRGGFDLVITDVRMPLMDGFELCRALKDQFGGSLPVILLTSVTDAEDVVRSLEAGADNFVGKPFDPEVLLERVVRTLERARRTRAESPLNHFQPQDRLQVATFAGHEVEVRSNPGQIAEILASTTQDALAANLRLRERDSELAVAHAALDDYARTLERRVSEATRALTERDLQLRLVVANLPIAVFATDGSGAITFAEGSSLAALHPDAVLPLGRPLRDLLVDHLPALAALDLALGGREAMARIEAADRILELRITPSPQGKETRGLACALIDITEHERTTAELDRLAVTDALTGLPNRVLLRDRLDQALRAAERDRGEVAVLFLDLDRFKEINDLHGHQAGDQLIRDVGVRVSQTLRASDTLGRLGGDEFAIVLPNGGLAMAGQAADRVTGALARPFDVEGVPLEVRASIGISASPQHGRDADELVRCADVAMFLAKRSGSGRQVYALDLDDVASRRQIFASELAHALNSTTGEFSVEFQPIVALDTGELCGVEALARWHHPVRGTIVPRQFVSLAAANGLSAALSDRVLDLALGHCAEWREAGLHIPVSVNLSASDLADDTLPERIVAKLNTHGLQATDLALELSERTVTADPSRARGRLDRLAGLGLSLAVDDYGSGGASIAELGRLPLSTVKLDMSIVRDVAAGRGSSALARATIDLAHTLGYVTVAKGVEGAAPLEDLRTLGCDHAQGHHLARPMVAGEVVEWARSRRGATGPVLANAPQ